MTDYQLIAKLNTNAKWKPLPPYYSDDEQLEARRALRNIIEDIEVIRCIKTSETMSSSGYLDLIYFFGKELEAKNYIEACKKLQDIIHSCNIRERSLQLNILKILKREFWSECTKGALIENENSQE